MAKWFDITDKNRHFELEVPRRALTNDMMRYAVFALSSRLLNDRPNGDWAEALEYHNKCLKLLIPLLSAADDQVNDEILSTVAICRLYEEMEDDDQQLHLTGVTRMAERFASFDSSTSLGKAATWLCLRQDIYISLVLQQPLRMRLDCLDLSPSIQHGADNAWANYIVLITAKILKHAFSACGSERGEPFDALELELNRWDTNKPPRFNPIKYQPPGKEAGRRLPVVWHLSPFHAVGWQYFHICKIVLAMSTSHDTPRQSSYSLICETRKLEHRSRDHLKLVLGLAQSNPGAENLLFTARHCLVAYGRLLSHELDQEAAIDFLRDMQKRTGWSMVKLIETLKMQWEDDGVPSLRCTD